ncbi:helix-turn-helix domain-containing protein [Gordonia sp. NPDC003425]
MRFAVRCSAPGERDTAIDDDPSFAAKLGALFERARDENGLRYTGKKIAEKANARGFSLSDAYISQLRTGKARTPSFRTVEAIASAFEVSVTYFLSNPDEDLDRVRRQRDYAQLLVATETHLSGVDIDSLCPTTIDVIIDLLKVVRAQAVLREPHTQA